MKKLYTVLLRELTTRKYVIKAASTMDAMELALACHEYQQEDEEFVKIYAPQESTEVGVEVCNAKT